MSVLLMAPNGARKTKVDHPALAIGFEEIVAEAEAAWAAGADAIHLHVREDDGGPSLDPGRYREAMDEIARRTDGGLKIQASTETVGGFTRADIDALLRALRPPSASVSLRDYAPDPADGAAYRQLMDWAAGDGVALQHILFHPDEMDALAALAPPDAPMALLFVLGRYEDGPPSAPRALLDYLAALEGSALKDRVTWMVCAFGRPETACLAAAAALGGHCRVGFENNFEHADGRIAASSAERVAAIRAVLTSIGAPRATPESLARTLGAAAPLA